MSLTFHSELSESSQDSDHGSPLIHGAMDFDSDETDFKCEVNDKVGILETSNEHADRDDAPRDP